MTAPVVRPALPPPSRSAAPLALAEGCRRCGSTAPLDAPAAEGMVEALRLLHRELRAWRCECLSNPDATAAAERPGLGAFARRFANWLQGHPERSNEPLEWLIREVLLLDPAARR